MYIKFLLRIFFFSSQKSSLTKSKFHQSKTNQLVLDGFVNDAVKRNFEEEIVEPEKLEDCLFLTKVNKDMESESVKEENANKLNEYFLLIKSIIYNKQNKFKVFFVFSFILILNCSFK